MNKERIQTNAAPAAIGTYSQAIKKGTWVFISGQIPVYSRETGLVESDDKTQIKQCFEHLNSVVLAGDLTLDDVVKVTIYVTDLSMFQQINQEMKIHFKEPYPARAMVEVRVLPKNAKIEIEAICLG